MQRTPRLRLSSMAKVCGAGSLIRDVSPLRVCPTAKARLTVVTANISVALVGIPTATVCQSLASITELFCRCTLPIT